MPPCAVKSTNSRTTRQNLVTKPTSSLTSQNGIRLHSPLQFRTQFHYINTLQRVPALTQLNLQLSTGTARAELAALDQRLDGFKAKLASFPQAKGLENSLAKLAAFKGIEAAAIQSIDRLASALGAAQRLADVSSLTRGLNSLARIRVDSIANNLERVSRALAGFRVPPSVARFASDLTKIASASSLAANGIMRVSRALGTIRAAPGLTSTARSLERLNASAAGAASGLLTFSRAGSTVSSILSGFGIVLGGVGFARVVQGSYDAVRAMDAFKNSIAATQGTAEAANQEWEYVIGVADRLRISIDATAKSYGSFSAAAHLAGVSTEDTHKIFEAVSEAARVLNMDAMKVENSFRALEQMFSKGTVGAEELRQQLGDALPGAMQLMAQAVGVSTGELMKMMQAGEVLASSALPAFADLLHQKYGAQVPQALNTAGAAFQNFSNAMSLASQSFGEGFFDAFKGSLNSLANTLKDPAFLTSARAWGEALGTAANVALQGIKLLTDNFGWLKYAVLGLIGLRIGSVVGGWATSLFALASAASAVTRSVAGVTVTIGGMSTLGGVFAMLRAGLMGAASAAFLFVRGLGPVGLAITALTVGVPLAIDLYNKWAASADEVEKANKQVAASSTSAAAGANDAAAAAKAVAQSTNQGASGATNFGRAVGATVPPVNTATDAYHDLAAAARSASAAMGNTSLPITGRRNKYGETIEEELSGYGYRTGGIAGKPTGKKYHLPASAWAGAPSFAGGGLSDGGIPAVLHPNEAVVPLAGGGTIPVQMMSSGQGSLLLLKPLQQLVDYQKQTKTSVERVWEATTNQTVIMRNAFDRVEGLLLHIDNQRFPDVINAITSLKSALGTVGGGFSGGGGSFGGTGAYSGSSVVDKIQAQLNRQLAEINAAATSTKPALGGPISGLTMVNGKVVAHGSIAYYQEVAKVMQAQNDLILAEIAAGFYSDADLQKLLSTLESKRGLGFASGSPNASKDMSGGFTATLHPDEAVIPLPDGRSVPVQLPSSFMERVEQLVNEGDARVMNAARNSGTSRSGGITLHAPINITIHAKDVESFRASQDQIMRELQKGLDRAVRNIGRQSDIDDPTRRT